MWVGHATTVATVPMASAGQKRQWQTGGVRVTVHSQGRPGAGLGCLGSILSIVVVVAVVAAILLGAFVILVITAAVMAIGLLAFAVNRLVMALNPRHRARRTYLEPSGQIIDATASLDPPDPPDPDGRGEEP